MSDGIVEPVQDDDVLEAYRPLTPGDRCDGCGAQAYVRVTLEQGSELLFCSHHFNEHRDKIMEIAVHVFDLTARLEPTT